MFDIIEGGQVDALQKGREELLDKGVQESVALLETGEGVSLMFGKEFVHVTKVPTGASMAVRRSEGNLSGSYTLYRPPSLFTKEPSTNCPKFNWP